MERRQDPLYREKEQLRNPTNHFTKCQNPVYHDEAQQSVIAAHTERRQDPFHHEEEQRNAAEHFIRRQDLVYRKDEIRKGYCITCRKTSGSTIALKGKFSDILRKKYLPRFC